MIAGFDPSLTHLGWVVFDENKTGKEAVLEGGVFKTSPADGLLVERLITQREKVRALLRSRNIKFISMEAPYLQDFNTELLFALNQHIHEVFLDEKIFVLYIQPQTLKRFAVPEIKLAEVTKHHVTHQAKKELDRMGRRFSEHVADAYFVGKLGLKFYQWYFMRKYTDDDLTERERKLFCGKHTFKRGNKKGLTEYTGIIYRENDQFFDYTKRERSSDIIAKEIKNGKEETFNAGRIL
jgi:Holliday junction resolvasome RuvABC endonuclease subunit